MNKRIGIIEVGSTNSKAYLCADGCVTELGFKTIEFKNNYNLNGNIISTDVDLLVSYTNSSFDTDTDVYVYGTSIFRELPPEKLDDFRRELQQKTRCVQFEVVSAKRENELTVKGAIRNVSLDGNVCVFIGGGGSTEVSICNNGKIIEMVNTPIGVSNVLKEFPDLAEDIANTGIDMVTEYITKRLNLPENKADYMILAGGDFVLRYENAGYPVVENDLFADDNHPYLVYYDQNIKYETCYYHTMHLSNMKVTTPDNPNWWNGTRAMCAFTNAVALAVEAKIIFPTKISMIFGIVSELMS